MVGPKLHGWGRPHLMFRRAPDDLSFPRRRQYRLSRTVFMERGRSKSSPRAVGAQDCARLAQSVRACRELWNSLELSDQRGCTHAIETCNRVARWRNLTVEICFIPDDEGIVVPVCVADIPKRHRTRQGRPAPRAVVHLHSSGQRPLALVCCPNSSGQQPHPAALILSGNSATTSCARKQFLPHVRHRARRSRVPASSRTLRQSSAATRRR